MVTTLLLLKKCQFKLQLLFNQSGIIMFTLLLLLPLIFSLSNDKYEKHIDNKMKSLFVLDVSSRLMMNW